MAKKTMEANSRDATSDTRQGRPIRLDLLPEDFERLERCARRRGLNKASYSRMAVLALIEQDEATSRK